jgi:hypothetical protein
MTTPEALEALGLVAPEDPAPNLVRLNTSRDTDRLGSERGWPDYERCVKGAPVAKEGGPDRSKADYVWCLMAAQRAATASRILRRGCLKSAQRPRRMRDVTMRAMPASLQRTQPQQRSEVAKGLENSQCRETLSKLFRNWWTVVGRGLDRWPHSCRLFA